MTLKTALVTVAVEVAPDEPPELLLPELLFDEPPEPLVLPEASTPITLKVTVNGSLAGLLNFRLRAADSSPVVNMLSLPTAAL